MHRAHIAVLSPFTVEFLFQLGENPDKTVKEENRIGVVFIVLLPLFFRLDRSHALWPLNRLDKVVHNALGLGKAVGFRIKQPDGNGLPL
ncbi:hypothetical protein SDC9_206893 [bioreactor metagenome]|uniref:Uncharacterized protein n=1 Tax=bioreactor metagenome TaxID=1076179 RepID=A0A645JHU3_9ZZZZ